MSSETTLVEAIDAIRAGDQETARTLLLELTQSAPQLAEGWLWLAAVTPNPAGKLAHLRQAHALAPNDRRTIAGLRALGEIVGDPIPAARQAQADALETGAAAAVAPKPPLSPIALPQFAPTGVRSRRPLPWGILALIGVALLVFPLMYWFT